MSSRSRRLALLSGIGLSFGFAFPSLAWPSVAQAREITCSRLAAESGLEIDGLLEEWEEFPGTKFHDASDVAPLAAARKRGRGKPKKSGKRAVKGTGNAWGGPDDLSLEVRCAYDRNQLYLALFVADDELVRAALPASKPAGPGEDHIELRFAGRTVQVYPADLQKEIPQRLQLGGGVTPKQIKVKESHTRNGWAVEAVLSWSALRLAGPPASQLAFQIRIIDGDGSAAAPAETMLATGRSGGAIVFEEGDSLLSSFLENVQAERKDIAYDRTADMTDDPGTERVVRVRNIVGVLGEDYMYVELPLAQLRDLHELKVVPLFPNGRGAIVARYEERGGGGKREVLAIFQATGTGLAQMFTSEVAKQVGSRRLETAVKFLPHGQGHDLVLEALPPKGGMSQSTYDELRAEDMLPILLPWEKKRVRYRFSDAEYFEVAP